MHHTTRIEIARARDTGRVAMFFGKGAVPKYSNKLKSNTKSLTITKLSAVDMYMLDMLWLLYFLQEQEYKVNHIELHQDNI